MGMRMNSSGIGFADGSSLYPLNMNPGLSSVMGVDAVCWDIMPGPGGALVLAASKKADDVWRGWPWKLR